VRSESKSGNALAADTLVLVFEVSVRAGAHTVDPAEAVQNRVNPAPVQQNSPAFENREDRGSLS